MLIKMSKFKRQIMYRWHKLPIMGYTCKRCGDWNQACPECLSPTKLLSHDPYTWQCLKCKKKFSMIQMDKAEYYRVGEDGRLQVLSKL